MVKKKIKNSYKLIDTEPALRKVAVLLGGEKILAVDTEANSMHAYREETSLIQISTKENNYIIDPLKIKNLSVLGSIFESPAVEKIFHAGEYDVLCLSRDYNFKFNNLFDTMTAAKILNVKKIGLGNILESIFNVKVSKKYQKADWGRRPLFEEMLDYAMTDTKFLIPLRNSYKKELIEQEQMALAEEEFRDLCRPLEIEPVTPESIFFNLIRKGKLNRRQKSVMWKLINIRDREAKKRDRPLFKVFSDKMILRIATELPRTKEKLSKIKGMSPFNMSKYAPRFLEEVRAKTALYPKKESRKKQRGGRGYLLRLEKIKKWRTLTGKKNNLASELVLPRHLMENIARKNPKTAGDLKKIMARFPHRHKLYSLSIEDLFQLPKALE